MFNFKNLLTIFVSVLVACSLSLGVAAKPVKVSMKPKYKKGEVIVKISTRKLYYVYAKGKAYEYPIAVPRSTGIKKYGKTRITAKRPRPTWYPTKHTRKRWHVKLPAAVPYKHPENALGSYALNLTWDLVRIHGTNKPHEIGKAKSGGCFRMYNRDIEHLARKVRVGTRVNVIR